LGRKERGGKRADKGGKFFLIPGSSWRNWKFRESMGGIFLWGAKTYWIEKKLTPRGGTALKRRNLGPLETEGQSAGRKSRETAPEKLIFINQKVHNNSVKIMQEKEGIKAQKPRKSLIGKGRRELELVKKGKTMNPSRRFRKKGREGGMKRHT